MPDLLTLPEWLGTAVVGAVIAALGYVAKTILEWWAGVREARRARRARLVALRALLQAAKASFEIQNDHAQRLLGMIHRNHPGLGVEGEGYERAFAAAYPQFTPEELELHGIIRGITIHALREANEAMLAWLREDAYFKAQQRPGTLAGDLAQQLGALEAHLYLWRAKYAAWIPDHPEHALVYLADEQAHGVGFPSGLDELVEQVLAG